jgi:hypothetical protein
MWLLTYWKDDQGNVGHRHHSVVSARHVYAVSVYGAIYLETDKFKNPPYQAVFSIGFYIIIYLFYSIIKNLIKWGLSDKRAKCLTSYPKYVMQPPYHDTVPVICTVYETVHPDKICWADLASS